MFDHVNGEKLVSVWADVKEIPYTKYDMRIDEKKYPISDKNDDVHDFLTYFKLIPTARATFDATVKHFMVYSKVR